MKKTILILTVILFAGITSLSAQEATKNDTKAKSKISEVSLICKMDCDNCANKVKKQLAFTKGITGVETDYEKDIVIVKYRNDKTDTDKIISSLAKIDYLATVKTGCCSGTKASTPCCKETTTKAPCTENAVKAGCKETNAKAPCTGTHAKTGCAGTTANTGCQGTTEKAPCTGTTAKAPCTGNTAKTGCKETK